MKNIIMGLGALAAVALPGLTVTEANAHAKGPMCSYQSIDRDGDLRREQKRCHHLPQQFQNKPRSGLTLYFSFGDGFYVDSRPRNVNAGRGQEQVCLVTFYKRNQVAAGADVNVQRATVLPIREAKRRDGPNDRNRIFDYGTNRQTRETCRYLDRINN